MSELVVVEAKKTKDRSPTFPFISLERALDRVRQFYAEERRGVAPYTRAMLHWGYSDSSSGGLQTVAALKSYGLLAEPGGTGKARQFQLSELALRILLDQRPDSPDRLGYIRQAARSPAVAADVYDKWSELPSDSTLNHYLVLEKKFNEATAKTAIRILKENQQFAGLTEPGVASPSTLNEGDEVIEESQQATPILRAEPVAFPGASASKAAAKPQVHTEQHLHLDGKTVITLHFSDTPSAEVYNYLSAITKFKADQLAKVQPSQEAAPKQ